MPNRLNKIQSYALFYGIGEEERFHAYDMVIFEPKGHTAQSVRSLNSKGLMLIAYLSVLEVPRQADSPCPDHVLMHNGQAAANDKLNNWILDPRATETKERVLHQVNEAMQLGYDGIFLDTLGDVEDMRFESLHGQLLPAVAWLLAEIRQKHPDCVVIQNWGLQRLLPYTANLLDGLCWEDFPYQQIKALPMLQQGIRSLRSLQTNQGIRILALNDQIDSEELYKKAKRAAERCGFLWYGTTKYIDPPLYSERG